MTLTVYAVVLYGGIHGDDVCVFGARGEAEACVREYAAAFWDVEAHGALPASYEALCEAWDRHDLGGAADARWELVVREVELDDPRVPPVLG